MHYEPGTEKVAMIGDTYTPVVKPLSLADEPQVKRTRKILLIIVGVFLALSTVNVIVGIFGSATVDHTGNSRQGGQIGQALISVLFYGFGLFVAYRYHQTGLRVFAWLGVISLIFMGVLIVLLLVLIVATLSTVNDGGHYHQSFAIGMSMGRSIITILRIAAFILTVIIIKLAFKLARLIDAHEHLTTQQV